MSTQTNNASAQQLGLVAQYVARCTFDNHIESSLEIRSIKDQVTPNTNINVDVKKLEQDIYQITVSVNFILSAGLKKIFTINLDMVGEFMTTGFDDNTLEKILNIQCPTMLTPFVNERLGYLIQSSIIGRPPMPNINFEEIYIKKFA